MNFDTMKLNWTREPKEYFIAEDKIEIITKKPSLPSADELEANPRARSAKLRIAEKL